jgi:hypothetical protein
MNRHPEEPPLGRVLTDVPRSESSIHGELDEPIPVMAGLDPAIHVLLE